MILTVDVPEPVYVEALTMLRDLLAGSSTGGEARVLEARLRKRTWTGPAAVGDAEAVLSSCDAPVRRLVEIFLAEDGLSVTEAELGERLNMPMGKATSYRRLLGKQSWRNGERLNPISSDTATKPARLYMRPETREVFATANATANTKGA